MLCDVCAAEKEKKIVEHDPVGGNREGYCCPNGCDDPRNEKMIQAILGFMSLLSIV